MHDTITTVRRVVGLDLGIATAHTAQVLDEAAAVITKRRVVPTVESFTDLEQAALAGTPEGTRLEIVIEPTGPAWLPVAVWFTARGHTVFRVSTQKAADLRRFLSRHAKSNAIDAHTLARLPMIDPEGLKPVALPATSERAELDRRVRASARLTREIGERKVRIIELARQLMPTIGPVLSQKLSRADLAVLERYADPRQLAKVRRDRLVALISKASGGHATSETKADGFRAAACAAVTLYGDTDAVAFDVIADEIATEIRLLRAAETERDRHDKAREAAYLAVDPDQLARSLPGVGAVGAPMLVAIIGDPDRFPNGSAFKAYLGLTPRASETGETDRNGQPMSKAGNRDLRTQLIRSAETARRHDPQLAAVYYDQMVRKGAVHTKALCVVAAKLAERAWTALKRGTAYELRDIDGAPVTPEEAKRIIAERYVVPEDVRRQRRSKKKGGKAPQDVQTRQRRSTRRPSHPSALRQPARSVKTPAAAP